MSQIRGPTNKNRTDTDAAESLPHERERDKMQPYSKEGEDYSGKGVARPPKEQRAERGEQPPRAK